MSVLLPRDKEMQDLLTALGIDPSTTRAVDIRIRPDEIVTITVESIVTSEQGKATGEVIREHLAVYKRLPSDPIGRNPNMGVIDVTNLQSKAREYVMVWPKWPFRFWAWLKCKTLGAVQYASNLLR